MLAGGGSGSQRGDQKRPKYWPMGQKKPLLEKAQGIHWVQPWAK